MENGEDAIAVDRQQQQDADGVVEPITGVEELHSPTKGDLLQLDNIERTCFDF